MTDEPPGPALDRYLSQVEPRAPRRRIPRRDVVIAGVLGMAFLALYLGPVAYRIVREWR